MVDLVHMAQEAMKSQLFAGGLMLTVIGSAVAWGRKLPKDLAGFLKRRFIVQVDVMSTDPLFGWTSRWLDEHPNIKRSRLITASARESVRAIMNSDDEDDAPPPKPQIIFTPAPGRHYLWHKGRPIMLYRERKDAPLGMGGREGSGAFVETFTMRALGRNSSVLRKVLEEARDLSMEATARKVEIYGMRYGDWRSLASVSPRPLATVFLNNGKLEALTDDLAEFLASEKWYTDRGVPWRRGHMYEGPPGNGKSSVVAAVAGHLKLHLYICAISDKQMTDEKLLAAVQDMRSRSVLLLEDVDAIVAERDIKGEGGITFAGLLNALDGVTSKPGVITIMTTNHPEKLDPALIRKGRVDLSVHFGNATAEQARRIFLHFYEGLPDAVLVVDAFAARAVGHPMATLQAALLDNKTSPVAAVGALEALTLPEPEGSVTEIVWEGKL